MSICYSRNSFCDLLLNLIRRSFLLCGYPNVLSYPGILVSSQSFGMIHMVHFVSTKTPPRKHLYRFLLFAKGLHTRGKMNFTRLGSKFSIIKSILAPQIRSKIRCTYHFYNCLGYFLLTFFAFSILFAVIGNLCTVL